jgi:hypothetical protein
VSGFSLAGIFKKLYQDYYKVLDNPDRLEQNEVHAGGGAAGDREIGIG